MSGGLGREITGELLAKPAPREDGPQFAAFLHRFHKA